MSVTDALKKHLQREKASFHMPGHKNGAAFFDSPLYNDIFMLDTTELDGTDCLCAPTEFLKTAQNRAAAYFGADEAFFLVNGSTGGILSMFYAAFKEGDRVIVDRNCHKSAVSAISLSGVNPVFVTPEKDEEKCVSGKIDPKKIEKLFEKYPDTRGVYITSPNYYGICSDVKKIAEIAHRYSAVLLVDEAHGAHFPFSEHFPENAVSCGADIAVTSLHKSLPSPNQTALLCKKGNRICDERLKNSVFMFQTTSPSYILLAYADFAISMAKEKGEELTQRLLSLKRGIKSLKTDDPFKIIISFKEKGYSGGEIEEILREKFGIFAELSDHVNVLLMASWGNSERDFSLLKEALEYIENLPSKELVTLPYPEFSQEVVALPPKEILNKETETIDIENASGKICAHTVAAFPPCIPVLLPGEIIEKEHIRFLKDFKGKITGMTEGKITVIK